VVRAVGRSAAPIGGGDGLGVGQVVEQASQQRIMPVRSWGRRSTVP